MKEDVKLISTFSVLVLVAILLIGGAMMIGSILLAPVGVVQKTLQTDNIINNYEWYHDAAGSVRSRVSQIRAHKEIVKTTTDAAELGRLRIELSAMQQSCRDLTNQYNANAAKVNRSIFQHGVPSRLDASDCE